MVTSMGVEIGGEMELWPFVIFPLLSYLLPSELIYNAAKSFTARNIRNHCEYKFDAAWNKVETVLRFSYTAVSIERRDIEHEFVNILEEEVFNGVADIYLRGSLLKYLSHSLLTFQLWGGQMPQRRNFLRLLQERPWARKHNKQQHFFFLAIICI